MYRLKLKELLEEKHVSMGELSRKADVSLNLIWKMCNQTNYNPTLLTMLKITDYLHIPLDSLYERTDTEKAKDE